MPFPKGNPVTHMARGRAGELDAAHVRNAEVPQGEILAGRGQAGEPGQAVLGGDGGVPATLEHAGQHLEDSGSVIHDEDPKEGQP